MEDRKNDVGLARVLWQATSAEASRRRPAWEGRGEVDVVVVGGGYTGLSTALHCATAGLTVVLLEAKYTGYGASGRNGGQVQGGWKAAPSVLARQVGEKQAEQILKVCDPSADLVFELIGKHGIQCDPVPKGLLRGIHREKNMDAAMHYVDEMSAAGAPVRLLDRAAAAKRIGTTQFFGAIEDARGGSVNPFAYAAGLARAAEAHGARIFEDSPALSLQRSNHRWRVTTRAGDIDASHVVVGTNGYSGPLIPALQQSLVPVNSFQVATRPLSPELLSTILPGGEVASDTRQLVRYFRRDVAGRLILGGRGRFSGVDDPRRYEFLRDHIRNAFPQLQDLAFEYYWSGRVAMTFDGYPHVHEPEPGLHMAVGYCGRGIALATMMGKQLAQRILGADPQCLGFPLTPIKHIPLWRHRNFFATAAGAWFQVRDKYL